MGRGGTAIGGNGACDKMKRVAISKTYNIYHDNRLAVDKSPLV